MGAYNEIYLDDAMRNLGEMLDYAVNDLGADAELFLKMFTDTGIAYEIERCNPKYIAGMSGTELAQTVVDRAGTVKLTKRNASDRADGLSNVYWIGWVLAYYQWHSRMRFSKILEFVTVEELKRMYITLHEASEDVFVNRMNARVREAKLPARLQQMRRNCGYSQSSLAKRSGVNVRAIQEYESKARNINKANGETLQALASTLGCRMEDIMEYNLEDVM